MMSNFRSPGLYIHFPFCMSRCPYCDFYSTTDRSPAERYISSVLLEAERYAGRFDPFGTLYLGGGTPSILAPDRLAGLLGGIRERLDLIAGAEVTIEANPDDLDDRKLEAYLEAGINRISIGVQSFDDSDLRLLGRRHGGDTAARAVVRAAEAGFGNIGIDLIFGFPGHSPGRWRETLEQAAAYTPAHISCYQMTIEDSTPMGRQRGEGTLVELNGDAQAELFLLSSEYLAAKGYLHYEVSNFALGRENISKHNSRYWDHTPYLGLGPSAHSLEGGKRWWNVSDIERYCAGLEGGNSVVEGSEDLTSRQMTIERLYFGFRTSRGLDLSFLGGFSGGSEKVKDLEDRGLVTVDDGMVMPTDRGYLLADRLPLLFFGGSC